MIYVIVKSDIFKHFDYYDILVEVNEEQYAKPNASHSDPAITKKLVERLPEHFAFIDTNDAIIEGVLNQTISNLIDLGYKYIFEKENAWRKK